MTLADLIKSLEDGLEGVAPGGPWAVTYDVVDAPHEIVQADNPDNRVCFPTSDAPLTAEHIARCSPDNIRLLLDSHKAMNAALEAARKVRDGYADQARFADHEPAAYFRDFVRRLDAALQSVNSPEHP